MQHTQQYEAEQLSYVRRDFCAVICLLVCECDIFCARCQITNLWRQSAVIVIIRVRFSATAIYLGGIFIFYGVICERLIYEIVDIHYLHSDFSWISVNI